MLRYLNEPELRTRLRLGKSVEQWLGVSEGEDYTVIRWLSVEQEREQFYNAIYLEVFDDGDEDFTDVSDFSPVDPDEPYGIIHTFSSIDNLLGFVQETYSASLDKFVSEGMISSEYIDFLKTRK